MIVIRQFKHARGVVREREKFGTFKLASKQLLVDMML